MECEKIMRCLVVEDDVAMGTLLADCLGDLGHDVTNAHSVEDALVCLKNKKYGLLILDYLLPDGTSLEVADYASITCPNVRTILLTGSNVFPNGEGGVMAPGIDWILRKPVPLADIEAVVDYATKDAERNPPVSPANA